MYFNIGSRNKTTFIVVLILLVIILIHVILRALDGGNDINVYLFAARQLGNGENFYEGNPYNNYLYSPFFALMLHPVSLLGFQTARVIWVLINLLLAIRLLYIFYTLVQADINLSNSVRGWWIFGTTFIALGFLNDNFILGQVTILILWLTMEGLYQVVFIHRSLRGALLLALGISIKVIPIIGLFYLFFKGKIKALLFCISFVGLSLFLPSVFIGQAYNQKMLKTWIEAINPGSNKYVFENDDGIHSLNALLPAYFFTFHDGYEPKVKLKRQIVNVPKDKLVIIMQTSRVALLASSLLLFFHRRKKRDPESLYIHWELSYLALVSALIFPHQAYYAMLYCVPAGSYLILFIILSMKSKIPFGFGLKALTAIAFALLFIMAIKGRDTLGSELLEILNFYHFEGLANIVFLIFILVLKPEILLRLTEQRKSNLIKISDMSA